LTLRLACGRHSLPRRVPDPVGRPNGTASHSLPQRPYWASDATGRAEDTPNGKYAKVWLSPFKVENKCGDHSKQWVEMVFHDTDEDSWIINVAAGTRYKNGATNYRDFQVYARLGRGVFCAEDADKNYADLNSVETVYRKGSTWRAACNPDDESQHGGDRLLDLARSGHGRDPELFRTPIRPGKPGLICAFVVGGRGFEPLAPSASRRCSTPELTAR
jgi:hypothetical protein